MGELGRAERESKLQREAGNRAGFDEFVAEVEKRTHDAGNFEKRFMQRLFRVISTER